MSTTQRQERTPSTTRATSPASRGRLTDRSDADRSSTSTTSTAGTASRVAGLVVAALLLGGLVTLGSTVLRTGDAPAPSAPVQEIRDEHVNRIPLGPTGPAGPPPQPYRGDPHAV